MERAKDKISKLGDTLKKWKGMNHIWIKRWKYGRGIKKHEE